MSMPNQTDGTSVLQKPHLIAAGGDLRQLAAARTLAAAYQVTLIGFDRCSYTKLPSEAAAVCDLEEISSDADVLLLPMPVSKDEEMLYAPYSSRPIPLSDLCEKVRSGGTVLGGRISASLSEKLTAAGFKVGDYAAREDFCVRNAVPTAEGALQIILQELPVTIHGLHILLLGAGRISKALYSRLRALGAEVTVAARRCSDLAWAECDERKPCMKA